MVIGLGESQIGPQVIPQLISIVIFRGNQEINLDNSFKVDGIHAWKTWELE